MNLFDRLYAYPPRVYKVNILVAFALLGNKRARAWLDEPPEPSQHFTR
jgi:hypothetical protein